MTKKILLEVQATPQSRYVSCSASIIARLNLSVFVHVKGVAMSSVLLLKTAVRGYLLGNRVRLTDSRGTPQDLGPQMADTESRIMASPVVVARP